MAEIDPSQKYFGPFTSSMAFTKVLKMVSDKFY